MTTKVLHLPESARTGGIYLPPGPRAEIARDRAEIAAQYVRIRGTLDRFNEELRRIDPHLSMVKAHDRVALGSPLKAGYYHVIRESPGHPTTVMPVEHDDGSYKEPDSSVFEMIERNDMWNDRAVRASRNRQRRLRDAADRQRQRDSEERVGNFNERWASANRTQILVKRSI